MVVCLPDRNVIKDSDVWCPCLVSSKEESASMWHIFMKVKNCWVGEFGDEWLELNSNEYKSPCMSFMGCLFILYTNLLGYGLGHFQFSFLRILEMMDYSKHFKQSRLLHYSSCVVLSCCHWLAKWQVTTLSTLWPASWS